MDRFNLFCFFKRKGQLLLGVAFIISMKVTLGATIQSASRLIFGGALATLYSLFVVLLLSRNIFVAVGSTTILVFAIVYTDLPILTRRFTIVPTCIIILQWFSKSHLQWLFAFQIWFSLSLGCFLAIFVQLIPLPTIPTALREFRIRVRSVQRQIRRELTTIILLIFEYNDRFNRREARSNVESEDQGIEIQFSSNSNDDQPDGEYFNDDHLLRSDLEDLNSLVNQEIQSIQRCFNEIFYEPYFLLVKYFNRVRSLLRLIPCLRKCIDPPSTNYQDKLSTLLQSLQSIQRIISSLTLLDKHSQSLIGQRRFINSIAALLEVTFNYFDLIIDDHLNNDNRSDKEQLGKSRSNIEDSLENFFEECVQFREKSLKQIRDNHEETHLNTFILLLLRCVHVVMSIDENNKKTSPKTRSIRESCRHLIESQINYIGLKPTTEKIKRSLKTSLSVLLSSILAYTCRDRLQAYHWFYWAPMTTALVSDSSEGGTIRLSLQRLMAVLLGSTYAYLVVLLTQHRVVVGISISLFVSLMGYLKTDAKREYFASVCAQSASIITLLSNQQGQINASNKAVLARTSLTFLGVFVHVFVSNLIFPTTARFLVKKRVSMMIKNVIDGLTNTIESFRTFIDPSNEGVSKPSNRNLTEILSETERFANNLPSLIDEALNEPNLWKRPFVQVKDRYQQMAKDLKNIVSDIRFIHRCTIILKAESTLHFALEARWQIRRISYARFGSITQDDWTKDQLEKEKHLLKEIDVPLKMFTSQKRKDRIQSNGVEQERVINENECLIRQDSSRSLRSTNLVYYRSVLEHLNQFQKEIIELLKLIDEFINQPVTVDIGFDGFHQFYRSESVQFHQSPLLNRDPSIFIAPGTETMKIFSSNPYRCCWSCRKATNDKKSLPSLRSMVDRLNQTFNQFLLSNNRFLRSEHVSDQSIGDILAFHTLSFALANIFRSTMNIAKNARRIKYLNINPRQNQT